MQNMSADPLSGLKRRSPSDLVNLLLYNTEAIIFHEFQVKNGNRYIAGIFESGLKVWDYNGIEQTVHMPDTGYPNYCKAVTAHKVTTLNNETYIANTAALPAMLPDVMNYRNQPNQGGYGEAIIEVVGGNYGRTYTISIDGVLSATYTTPSGAVATDINATAPHFIMGTLLDQLRANQAGLVPASDGGSTLWFSLPRDFTVSATDDAGNTLLKVTRKEVTRTEDLPAKAPDGFAIKVVSANDPDMDVWYKFQANQVNGSVPQEGTWKECVAPNIPYKIDPSTMPHVLEYDAETGEFTLKTGDWVDRACGTEDSNPTPSFIGEYIQDVFSFQSRLGFLAGPNCILSRTNRSKNFWQASATLLADTDPVDISSTSVLGALRAAVAHDRDLVLFSQRGQFIISGRTAITPKNASMVLTTAFEADLTTRPVPAGRNVFFPTQYGKFSGMREFYTEGGTDINDSRSVTQHVKEYIKGKVIKMSASSNYDTLLVQGDTDPTTLYTYQYIWSDSSKVQSAWSTWKFWCNVTQMWFDDAQVYCILNANGYYFLHRMSLDQTDTEGVGFPVYMDSRFDVTGIARAFAVPYDVLAFQNLVVVQGVGCPNPGATVDIVDGTYQPGIGYVYTLAQSMNGGNVIVGVPFESRYIPTPPAIKDQDGAPVLNAKFRISKYLVYLSKTARCTAQLLPKWGGPSQQIRFEGRILGTLFNNIGSIPVMNETFIVPFREEPELCDMLISESGPYPMTLLDVEWMGQYNKKGRRISVGGTS